MTSEPELNVSDPATIRRLLTAAGTLAVVGCSPNPGCDSHRVSAVLQPHGCRVIPVNPVVEGEILGERVYPSLTAISVEQHVDMVDILRRSDQAGAHVDEAIVIGEGAVWMQLGVIDPAAARRRRRT